MDSLDQKLIVYYAELHVTAEMVKIERLLYDTPGRSENAVFIKNAKKRLEAYREQLKELASMREELEKL